MNLLRYSMHLALLITLGTFTQEATSAETTALPRTQQVVVATPSSWSSKTAPLQAFEKEGDQWVPLFSEPIRVQLGRNGSGWGRGALQKPDNIQVSHKREGDGKAPAGIFKLGKVLGYTETIPGNTRYPYNQVNEWDAWVDDVENPFYNRHVEINPKKDKVPSWFESQRMRLGDGAYKWMIEIHHNFHPKTVPGAGSAIFFHIRRGADRYTSGCTAMQETHLVTLIQWLKTSKNPHYILLPQSVYHQVAAPWQLPTME